MKKNKLRTKQQRKTDNRTAKAEPPSLSWWKRASQPDVVVIGVGVIVATIVAAVLINRHATEELHSTHRPSIAFTRSPVMLDPLICNSAKHSVGNLSLRIYFRNVGNKDAINVLPLPDIAIVDGNQFEKRVKNFTGFCSGMASSIPKEGSPGYLIAPDGAERSLDFHFGQGFQSDLSPAKVEALLWLCATYEDEYPTHHYTCMLYRLMLAGGIREFWCSGQSINGTFDPYPFASCTN